MRALTSPSLLVPVVAAAMSDELRSVVPATPPGELRPLFSSVLFVVELRLGLELLTVALLGEDIAGCVSLAPVELSMRESVAALVEPYVEPVEAGDVALATPEPFSLFVMPPAPESEAAPEVEVLVLVLESVSFEVAGVVLGVGEGSLELLKIELLGEGELVSFNARSFVALAWAESVDVICVDVPYAVSVEGAVEVELAVVDNADVSVVEEDLVVWLQPLRTKPRNPAIKMEFFIGV